MYTFDKKINTFQMIKIIIKEEQKSCEGGILNKVLRWK